MLLRAKENGLSFDCKDDAGRLGVGCFALASFCDTETSSSGQNQPRYANTSKSLRPICPKQITRRKKDAPPLKYYHGSRRRNVLWTTKFEEIRSEADRDLPVCNRYAVGELEMLENCLGTLHP